MLPAVPEFQQLKSSTQVTVWIHIIPTNLPLDTGNALQFDNWVGLSWISPLHTVFQEPFKRCRSSKLNALAQNYMRILVVLYISPYFSQLINALQGWTLTSNYYPRSQFGRDENYSSKLFRFLAFEWYIARHDTSSGFWVDSREIRVCRIHDYVGDLWPKGHRDASKLTHLWGRIQRIIWWCCLF